MKLELNGIDVDCIIGERPDERQREQRLRVDLALEIDDTAAETDDLADTVDYAALAGRIRAALAGAKCRMIERAAKIAADAALAEKHVTAAEARVVKSGAVAGLASAAAVYAVRRGGMK